MIKNIHSRIIKVFLLIFFIITIICPLMTMFANLANTNILQTFQSDIFITTVMNSVFSTTIATLIAIFLAIISAWFVVRSNLKFKHVFIIIFTLPMLIPSISHGTGLVVLLGNNGVLTNILGINFNIYGFVGIVLGSLFYSFPVAFLMLYDIFQYEDCSVYSSANVMGIPKWSQMLKITFPYLKKPLISVFFTVFTLIFTDYGVPLMVGGKFMTLPLYMYNEVIGLLDFGKGATVGLVLMLPAFIAFVIDLFQKNSHSLSFVSEKYTIGKNKIRDILAQIWSMILSFVIILPIITFILLMFLKKYPISLTFSLEHITRAMNMGLVEYLINSLIIAIFTAILGVCVSYTTAYFTARSQGKVVKSLHLVSMMTLAIPGIVLGLSYVLFFKSTPIYGMLIILILVNTIHFFASPYLMAYNALGKLNSNYENVAKTLGITKWRLVKDVLIPQTIDTLLEMFSYFFVNAMVTISAVSFLSTRSIQPLSLMIPNLESMMLIESISFVSIVILLINLLLKLIVFFVKKLLAIIKEKGEAYSMNLNKKEFSVLTLIESHLEHEFTQREISEECGISLGTVNSVIQSLGEKGYIDSNNNITEDGYNALEPYRVKRAIFIAAGFGSRLVPLTINSPKPLIRVNGVRMIDTLLDAVVNVGIEEIYIVRGYLKEQFDQLLYKYPQIKFIDNPDYNEANNISSAMYARHLLQNAYVLEADLVLYNPKLITKYQYTSNYLGVKTERTDDWCFQTDKNKIIKKLLVGGRNVYHMYGISYWNEKDGEQLEEDIKKTYELPGGKERYWDQVSLEYFKNNYKLEVRECTFDDIIEIDSYSDLKKIDKHYNV